MEMARMSLNDGLVMQLHVGSYRNHSSYTAVSAPTWVQTFRYELTIPSTAWQK